MAEPLRIMSLHALAYCERLFYLEEVEEMRVADERVYAGRRLHVQLEKKEKERKGNVMVRPEVLRRRKNLIQAEKNKNAPWEKRNEMNNADETSADPTQTAGETPALQSADETSAC